MENSKISKQFETLEKSYLNLENSYLKLKKDIEEEVTKMETTLNKEKIREFNNLLIRKITISSSINSYGETVINVGGFESSQECRSHSIDGFRMDDSYSRSKSYEIKGKENEELKTELEKVKLSFINFIENLYETEKPLCEENSLIAKMNGNIYNGLMEHITALGFNKTYLGYKTKRSKYQERLSYGFVDDLKNQVKTIWWKDSAEQCKNELIKKIDILISEVLKMKIEERRKEVEENRRKFIELKDSGILNELETLEKSIKELDLDGLKRPKKMNGILDLKSIKEKFFSINRFIEIGYLLELNRNKLNNGTVYADKAKKYLHYYPSYSLKSEDKEWLKKASDELDETISIFTNDGRVFRDMVYNYNEFYNKAAELNDIPFNKVNKVISKLLEIELKLDII